MIALTAAEITRRMAAEACRVHWPAFDERNGLLWGQKDQT